VTEKIGIEQLTELMATHPPDEIRDRHWDQMDDVARRRLEAFLALCDELDTLPETLARLTPAMPVVVEEAEVVPFPERRGTPMLGLPLVAAATFVLGLLVPGLISPPAPQIIVEQPPPRPAIDNITRTVTDLPMVEIYELDRRLAEGFFERGVYFFDHNKIPEALTDLERAHQLDPNDHSTLEYLMVITDELDYQEAFLEYKARLAALRD